MATFSVDITSVVFAGARTGYKDITITGMPAGGVTTSLTGTYFTYTNNPESQGTNVYRVSTKSTNTGNNQRTGTFRIVNASDSTDYVTVSLKQIPTYGLQNQVYTGSSSYSDIYADSRSGWGYFPYSLSDLTGHIEVLVDGYTEYTKDDSWISVVAETTYIDTGFKRILVSCSNNYDGPRSGYVYFGGTSGYPIKIHQNGYPSSTSGCTQSVSFIKSGGTQTIDLKIPSQENVNNVTSTTDLTSFTSPSISQVSGTRLNWSLTVGTNNTGNDLRGLVSFNAGSAYQYAYLGHTIITQSAEDTPTSTLEVDPEVLTYPATGGARVLDVTYTGTLTTSTFPAWLTYQTVQVDTTHRSYTITASSNSSTSSRSFNLEISNGTDTVTVPITQAGAEAASLTISPTGASVGSAAGRTQVAVTSTGIDEVNYSISEGWVTFYSLLNDTYTFSYAANSTSSSRSCMITFYGGGLSKTFVLNQEAGAISVSPASSTVESTSGTVQVTVTGASNITYSISGSWLTYRSKSGNVYTFAYTENSASSQRTATVTFSATGVADATYSITQAAAGPAPIISVTPTELYFSLAQDIPDAQDITVMCNGTVTPVASSDVTINSVRQISGGYVYNVSLRLSTSATSPFTNGTIVFNGDNSKTVSLYGNRMFGTPKQINVGNAGGTYREVVYYYKVGGGVKLDGRPNWVEITRLESSENYTSIFNITVQPNTSGSSRSGYILFVDVDGYAGNQYKQYRVDITQSEGGGGGSSISISPTSSYVDNLAGRKVITLSTTGIGVSDVQITSNSSWITVLGQGTNIIYVDYTENTSMDQRSGKVTFSASGVNPVTYNLVQAGRSASFSVIPSSLTFHKEGGSDNLTFFNIPSGGLSWDITYGSGTDWISSISFNNNVATVSVTENTGSRRNAVIRFYNQDDNEDYLDLIIVQNGEGFDSIWFDRAFEPSSFQVGENYHYKLQDHSTNNIIYEGITVPVSDTENPLGINIPRLVDSYIHSNILDDLREDMTLRKLDGSLSVDFYDMNGSTPSLVKTFNYWNDWSGPGYNTVYDITQTINDPINHKGCNYMIIPFCIYDDELSSYTVVETKKDGTQVNYPMGTPSDAFMYAAGEFFNAKSVSFKKGNDTLLTYDMDNCGEGFLLYKNRFGGWDSFLIEGNIYKYDEYTRLSGVYPKYPNGYGYSREKMTDRNTIRTRYEINTGWLTDEQAERLVFHLMSSTTVALRSFSDRTMSSFPYNMVSVSIVDSSAEYKKFRNGKRMINYTITLEENDTKQVQR